MSIAAVIAWALVSSTVPNAHTVAITQVFTEKADCLHEAVGQTVIDMKRRESLYWQCVQVRVTRS